MAALPEAAAPITAPDRKPLPINLPPPRRKVQRTVGVWSPFGEVFHPHGEIALKLGRKPMRPEELELLEAAAKAPPAKKQADEKSNPAKKQSAASRLRQQMASAPKADDEDEDPNRPLPPAFKRGLGLGLGLHPHRFPRELLKSSESRMRSCNAGYLGSLPSSSSLMHSSSEPALLPRQQLDGASSGDPVRTLFPFHAEAAAPAEEPPKPPEDPPVGLKAKSRLVSGRPSRFANPTLGEDGEAQKPKLSEFERAVRPLPLGRRAQVEFKQVQRESRLRLQEALAERTRLRDSVYALRYDSSLDPLVVDRHSTLLNERRRHRHGGGGSSSTLSAFSAAGGGGSASVPELAKGAAAARRQDTGGVPANAGGKASGSHEAGAAAVEPTAHPLGKLGTPGLWHEATASVSQHDGGVLRLWQALREHAERPRPLPARGELLQRPLSVAQASALVQQVFEHLHGLLDAPGGERPSFVGLELIESLFRACSHELVTIDGAREVLLPMLRVAAECANIGADETRRLHLTYAYPQPEDTASTASPGSIKQRRASAGSIGGSVAGSPDHHHGGGGASPHRRHDSFASDAEPADGGRAVSFQTPNGSPDRAGS